MVLELVKLRLVKAIVSILLNLRKDNEESIALLAPTGRASKRLAESTLLPAMTIHRFLKWDKENDTFLVNEYMPSNCKYIIVDEVSMIDNTLMASLLRGLKDDVKLVLVGDYYQLPSVREGQVLGVAGIEGNGQSELVNAIVGTTPIVEGKIVLENNDITNESILKRQKLGISHVSEDRLHYGSAPNLSIEDNAISKIYASIELNNKGLLNLAKVKEFTTNLAKEFIVKYDNTSQAIKDLSGGNIQKVIVGREFLYDPKLLIVNQPTRGIDVGAIEFIRHKILDMGEAQKAILLISSDLGEVLPLSDSIIVMHEGKIVGYIEDAKNVTEEELGLYMLGVKHDSDEVIGGAYYA